MSKIKRLPSKEPCPINLKMQQERAKVLSDIQLLSAHNIPTPKAFERLAFLNNKLTWCDGCRGNCHE